MDQYTVQRQIISQLSYGIAHSPPRPVPCQVSKECSRALELMGGAEPKLVWWQAHRANTPVLLSALRASESSHIMSQRLHTDKSRKWGYFGVEAQLLLSSKENSGENQPLFTSAFFLALCRTGNNTPVLISPVLRWTVFYTTKTYSVMWKQFLFCC